MDSEKNSWKSLLYERYITSGQAGTSSYLSPEQRFAPRAPYLIHLFKTHLPAQTSIRVLDIGCGHGTALYFLSKLGYQNIEGMDVSAEQIALAHQLGIPQAKLGTLEEALASQPDGSVDVVMAMDVFEHLDRAELFATLEEVRRVLKPGGMCLIHVPNAEGFFGMRIRYGDLTHELAFTASSARQMFQAVGFRSTECFEDKPTLHGVKSFVRRVLWEVLTAPFRLMLIAETGAGGAILSQGMIVKATL